MDSQGILSWNQLIANLHPLLIAGPTELERNKYEILKLLQSYKSKPSDYKTFCFFDDNGYTKNLVTAFKHSYNIIVMCWAAHQESLFHGHEGSRCFVKVLEGQMLEQKVPHPASTQSDNNIIAQDKEKLLYENDVNYIDDDIGVHKMINMSENPAVTLHVYLPAYEHCRVFKRADGNGFVKSLKIEESQCIEVTFFSDAGHLMK